MAQVQPLSLGNVTTVSTVKQEESCVTSANYGWFAFLILWTIIFIVLFWLIFYSLKPSFVLQSGSNQVDTAKVLLAAVISAFILMIIVGLIKAAISRKY